MADHEEFDGMCEECGQREASCTVAVMMDGQVTHRHLCGECLAKMNSAIAAGGVQKVLSALMSALTGSARAAAAEAPQEDVACPECGTAFSTVAKTGRLGCPQCYRAFEERLKPMLQQYHGHMHHVGRTTPENEAIQHRRARREKLSRQLNQAIAMEDYETAALLRDQMRVLAEKGAEN